MVRSVFLQTGQKGAFFFPSFPVVLGTSVSPDTLVGEIAASLQRTGGKLNTDARGCGQRRPGADGMFIFVPRVQCHVI